MRKLLTPRTSALVLFAMAIVPGRTLPVLRRLFLSLMLIGVIVPASAESPPPQRIVFVGDSITGLGRNREGGFINEMEKALRTTDKGTEWTLIALGGSGQSVGTWRAMEEKTRNQKQILDVPNIEVQETLSQPADVLVVMLGMNDVIAPYIDGSDASLDRWVADYEKLVAALRERIHPTTVALGGITPCTEDPDSPKNQLIDRMNVRVRGLAAKLGATYLPTAENAAQVLAEGRKIRPDFHISYDFVHPNEAGHQAIAIGMLEGLQHGEAARWLRTEHLPNHLGKAIAPSWEILSIRPEGASDRFTVEMRAYFPGDSKQSAELHITPPEGWTANPTILRHSGDTFTLSGVPDRLLNKFTLTMGGNPAGPAVTGGIPAPWIASAGLIQPCWEGETFDPVKGRIPLDEVIEKNGDFLKASPPELHWAPAFPSFQYSGGESASNLDFFAIAHPAVFEGGYAARWIYSERQQEVQIKLSSRMYGGQLAVTLWLNGHSLYQGQLEKEPSKTHVLSAVLTPGWNTLVVKTNHRRWLWQLAVEVISSDDTLRYAIRRPPSAPNP